MHYRVFFSDIGTQHTYTTHNFFIRHSVPRRRNTTHLATGDIFLEGFAIPGVTTIYSSFLLNRYNKPFWLTCTILFQTSFLSVFEVALRNLSRRQSLFRASGYQNIFRKKDAKNGVISVQVDPGRQCECLTGIVILFCPREILRERVAEGTKPIDSKVLFFLITVLIQSRTI